MNVLYATSEVFPLMKTGGLGDVAGSLPPALHSLHHDVVITLPAYRDALAAVTQVVEIAQYKIPGAAVSLKQCLLPNTQVKVWLVDIPDLFDRPGNPYMHPDGHPWHDNAQRFAGFSHAVAILAQNQAGLNWLPDMVHCNDWQTGLVPPLLALGKQRPASLFTIHNLAYQGLFSYSQFKSLHLPESLWSHEGLEFHNQISFMKGGLVYANRINAVSPNYAKEIQSPEFGYGLEGLLKHRSTVLSGILNGIDETQWDPAHDTHLVKPYSVDALGDKAFNKAALQQEFGLPVDPEIPLVGMVGRLVEQKGIDMVLDALPKLSQTPLQLAILGSGDSLFESTLRDWSQRRSQRISVLIGYDESLAHRIEAGADIFLMPSRFEPCGLNQMYSLRYGTLPVVRRTGGLVDTVVDATPENIAAGTATGVLFSGENGAALLEAINWTVSLYRDKTLWSRLQRTGMAQDFSWQRSAVHYVDLYEMARQDLQAA